MLFVFNKTILIRYNKLNMLSAVVHAENYATVRTKRVEDVEYYFNKMKNENFE